MGVKAGGLCKATHDSQRENFAKCRFDLRIMAVFLTFAMALAITFFWL